MAARLRLAGLPELLADDRSLLARFTEAGDEAAFAALVKRHSGLVLGVCRRAVGDAHLAEDAFQAVFLVLAKQPRAALKAASVAGWLFGIARRVGLAARRRESRRIQRERRAMPAASSESPPDWNDLLRVVDEELARLPEDSRAAVIACFLREQTHDEAARDLGWSVSTLRRRLERGKELLRIRLARRGATLAAGLFAGWLAPFAAAAPRELIHRVGRDAAASAMARKLAASVAGTAGVGKLAALMLAIVALAGIAAGTKASRDAEAAPSSIAEAIEPRIAPAPPSDWTDLTGQVVFPADQDLPERREIAKTDPFVKNVECCFGNGRRLFFDNIIIDPKSRAMANVVVWLRPDSPDSPDPKAAFPPERIHPKLARSPRERVIDVIDCQFAPRITVGRAGDTLRFKNSAPLATNVFYQVSERSPTSPLGAFNVLLPAAMGETKSREPLGAGTVPDRFSSSIYTWMKGYVWSFDHPYAAVTDAAGKFRIHNAPVGTWRLMMWHEEFGYSEGRLYGTAVKVAAGPKGAMDLGTRSFQPGKTAP